MTNSNPTRTSTRARVRNIENFGCRLNALDGDYINAALDKAGVENATVINSCAVTAQAVRQAKQSVRRAKRAHPDTPIFVTGCAAQTDADAFAAMPEVSKVLGNEEKLQPESYLSTPAPKTNAPALNTPAANINAPQQVGDIMRLTKAVPRPVPQNQNRTRAFVQVQTGCDHRCTFCIIPFGRGNARSTPIADVVRDCAALVEQGHKEIVLTGVDMTSWGADINEAGLGVLVQSILKQVPNLPRLRLSSVDAVELDAKLLDMVVEEERVMPHLHLSLQSGDNMILKRMKRRHSREDAIAFCADMKTKRPDIVFGADIIAGFPTETDAMFENSLRLVKECELTWLHVFPYSQRPNTPAANMPQVSGTIIKQRASALRAAGAQQREAWLGAQKGATFEVLVEKPLLARTAHFAQVKINSPQKIGQLMHVKITGHEEQFLMGGAI